MRIGLLVLFIALHAYSLTPFSLEGFRAANIKISDKGKIFTKEERQEIEQTVKKRVKDVGISHESERFSNFLVKIEAIKINEKYALLVEMFLIEDVKFTREPFAETIGITYKMSDFFESTEPKIDAKESILDYLLPEFLDQYREENR